MTAGQYIMASGIAGPTEQDTLDRMDEFIVGALGWSRLDRPINTGSDRKYVWFSRGEDPDKYWPIYASAQATSDTIYFSAYTNWVQTTSSGSDVISESTYLAIPNDNNGGSDEYYFLGNKDVLFISVRRNSNGANYLGGFGYWDTFYQTTEDPYPVWAMGQDSFSTTFASQRRVRSYGYTVDGFLDSVSTVSGGSVGFFSPDLSSFTALATPNPRDGRHLMLKSPFYRERSATEGGIPGAVSHEVRGEVPGLYQFYGTNFASHDRVTASGVSVGDSVPGDEVGFGTFLVVRSSQSNTMAIGPAVDWTRPPYEVQDLSLWLRGDAVYRRGSSDSGGFVIESIDLSGNKRTASQATSDFQPKSLSSSLYNNNIVESFGGSRYLVGSLPYTNNYSVFLVGNFEDHSLRSPAFHVRGPNGGNDTAFMLEFNSTVSGTADLIVRTDDSPSEEDVLRYSGLKNNIPYVLSAVVSGTDTMLYVNGDYAGTSSITNTKGLVSGSPTLNYGLGVELDSLGNPSTVKHSGFIAELIVYSRNITNEEHQAIICYLGDKYAITVSGTCT